MKSLDISFRSISTLNIKLTAFFKNENFILADPYTENYNAKLILHSKNQVSNVVLSGGFVSRFIEMRAWPEGQYRIWVLCHRAKFVLDSFFNLPESMINVVPRYELFPIKKKQTSLDFNIPLTLVYAGRFLRAKGVLNLLSMVKHIQNQYELPIKLLMCGEFRETPPINLNFIKMSPAEFNILIDSFIQLNKWMYPPKLKTGMTSTEWLSLDLENPVFVSLSQLSHEDFGVSLAQVQSLGWPCLLSSWGAHFDAKQDNTVLLPEFKIQDSNKEFEYQNKKLATSFLDSLGKQRNEKAQKIHSSPKKLPAFSLNEIVYHHKFAETKFAGILKHSENGFRHFLMTRQGKHFFSQYNKVFSSNLETIQ